MDQKTLASNAAKQNEKNIAIVSDKLFEKAHVDAHEILLRRPGTQRLAVILVSTGIETNIADIRRCIAQLGFNEEHDYNAKDWQALCSLLRQDQINEASKKNNSNMQSQMEHRPGGMSQDIGIAIKTRSHSCGKIHWNVTDVYSNGALKWSDMEDDSGDGDSMPFQKCVSICLATNISWHDFVHLVGNLTGVSGITLFNDLVKILDFLNGKLLLMYLLSKQFYLSPIHCQIMVDLLPVYFPEGLAVTFPRFLPYSIHFTRFGDAALRNETYPSLQL